jgi:hypothetical protein
MPATVALSRTANADVAVEGIIQQGTAVPDNAQPVLIGGSDGTDARILKVGLDGSIAVSIAASQSVDAAQSGTWTVQPGNTANTTPWLVTQRPATSGGSSLAKVLAAGSTNATSVKASAGQLYSYQFSNANAAFRYVHFYNKASAPTVGTDVPVLTVGVPAGGSVSWCDPNGTPFGTGIAYAITTGAAVDDTGAVSANDVMGQFTYK